ncbi:MAG: hypothetical protein J2P53_13410 [Bradyrhizobiaceae bacterium]|nr:hypothetical protein [Bradyrhizobiaceae bacterium]
MKKRIILAVLLTLAKGISIASATSGNVSGPAALAVAGVVAYNSSVLSSTDRRVMARLFAGHPVSFPDGRKISVTASSIDCRTNPADIASRTCDLAFEDRRRGNRTVSRSGRTANELFATLTTAGVASGGATGPSLAKVTKLVCTIDPNEIRQKTGSGADCVFEKGE